MIAKRYLALQNKINRDLSSQKADTEILEDAVINGNGKISFSDWEIGSFVTSTGANDNANTTRLRSSQYHTFDAASFTVIPKEGYKTGVYIWKHDSATGLDTFLKRIELTSDPFTVEVIPGTKYKFLVGKNDNSAAVLDFANHITVKTTLQNEVVWARRGIADNTYASIGERLNDYDNRFYNGFTTLKFTDWEMGTFTSTGAPDSKTTRLRSVNYHSLSQFKFFTITPAAGYKAGVYMYRLNPDGTYTLADKISAVTTQSKFVVQKSYFYKFLIAYSDDKVVDKDISQYVSFVGDVGRQYIGCSFENSYTNECTDMSTGDTLLDTMSSEDLLTEYETLRSSYPNYITRALLGYCSDANNAPDNTRPVYEYIIQPYNGTSASGLLRSVPEILILCGVHGNEKASSWSVLQMLKQAFDGHEGFAQIIANCRLQIIPVLNRYGWDNNIRGSARLEDVEGVQTPVDINRTFDDLSTLESVIVSNWQKSNKNAWAYVDFHNTANNGWYSYLTTSNVDLQMAYSSMIRTLAPIWKKKYNFDVYQQELNESRFIFIKPPAVEGGTYYALNTVGIKNAATIECGDYDPTTSTKYTKTVIECATDTIGNWLLSLLRKYYIY